MDSPVTSATATPNCKAMPPARQSYRKQHGTAIAPPNSYVLRGSFRGRPANRRIEKHTAVAVTAENELHDVPATAQRPTAEYGPGTRRIIVDCYSEQQAISPLRQ
jgi:hypothetical protein